MQYSRLLTVLLILVFSLGLNAQRAAQLSDTQTEYDKKSLPSLTLSLDAPVDDVYDPLQEFWEERYSIDIDREDKDGSSISYLAEQVRLPSVSAKNVDLYVNANGADRVSTVSLSLAFDGSTIVTKRDHPQAYQAARDLLEEFRTYFYTAYFDEKLAETRGQLEDLRDDSEDASKDAAKARKQIEKYEEKIEKYQRKIEDTREEVGDELETADEKDRALRALEETLRTLEQSRKNYIG